MPARQGISDPGERLVRAVLDAGFEVSTVPGPTALVAALVTSGLPTSRFVFEGFLPRAGKPRRDRLAELATERRTIVVYESPHRVARTLVDLTEAFGADRHISVARELTKLHETIVRAPLGEVELGEPRGEYVLVIAGAAEQSVPPDDDVIRAAIREERRNGASTRDAAATVARRLGVAKRLAYEPRGRRDRAEPEHRAEASTVWRRHPDARNELLVSIVDEPSPSADAPGPSSPALVSDYRRMVGAGPSGAFFDLDRTLISGSSAYILATAARSAGLVPTRQFVRDAGAALRFKLRGSTDRTTEDVRARILAAVKGMRVDDLVALNCPDPAQAAGQDPARGAPPPRPAPPRRPQHVHRVGGAGRDRRATGAVARHDCRHRHAQHHRRWRLQR